MLLKYTKCHSNWWARVCEKIQVHLEALEDGQRDPGHVVLAGPDLRLGLVHVLENGLETRKTPKGQKGHKGQKGQMPKKVKRPKRSKVQKGQKRSKKL
jgi:hypothetical protein